MSKCQRLHEAHFSALGAKLASATEVIKGRRKNNTENKLKKKETMISLNALLNNLARLNSMGQGRRFLKSIEIEFQVGGGQLT